MAQTRLVICTKNLKVLILSQCLQRTSITLICLFLSLEILYDTMILSVYSRKYQYISPYIENLSTYSQVRCAKCGRRGVVKCVIVSFASITLMRPNHLLLYLCSHVKSKPAWMIANVLIQYPVSNCIYLDIIYFICVWIFMFFI